MKTLRNLALIPLLAFCLLPLFAAPSASPQKGEYLFFVGTYTDENGKSTGSKGIYAFSYDSASGHIASLGLATETTNPSWLAISPDRRFLYAVNEVQNYKGPNSGGVSAFSIDRDKNGRATGKLTFLNEVSSRGAGPCYVTVDHTGRFVLVANYDGGSVAIFPVQPDGKLGEASNFAQHTGHGPNPKRQESPHAHSIDLSPDNRFAYVDDLGLDELLIYEFDSVKGKLTPNDPPFAKLDPGAGPRHFALSPSGKFAYVVSEMQGTITAFANDPATGRLERLQTVSTLPSDFRGEIEDAEVEVHPTGKFLYASNRGNDTARSFGANSIAIFTIDSEKGTLTLVETTTTVGKTPRSFEIDPTGTRLFAANQQSNNIEVFRINVNDDGRTSITKAGHLSATGPSLGAASPVCVKFLAVQ